MRKFLFTFCFALLALFLAANEPAEAKAKKRVFLEQYTGAWCGYCVDGTVKMDEIIEAYPDDVIGVKIHSGDPMEIPLFKEISSLINITGFPTGSVDRIPFNNTIPLDRSYWKQAVEQLKTETPVVDLKATFVPLPGGKDFTVNVTATFDSKPTKDMRLNFYVVEDDVTGGSSYNQANYYNNESGHPFYGKGNPVVGYKHQAVVRFAAGGALGAEGSLPAASQIQAGKSYTYSKKVTFDPSWNKDKIKFIGIAQFCDPSDIHFDNVVYATEGALKTETSSTGEGLYVVGSGETHTTSVTIKNLTNLPVDYRVQMVKKSGTPSDWSASFDISETDFRIQGKDSKTVSLTTKPGATIGIGGFDISIQDVDNPESGIPSVETKIFSKEMHSLYVDDAGDDYGCLQTIKNAGYTNFFTVTSDQLVGLKETLPNLKNVIWDAAELGALSMEESSFLSKYINNKANVAIIGTLPLLAKASDISEVLSDFGISRTPRQITENNTKNLIGYAGDPISDSFDQSTQLHYYLLSGIVINDKNITTPIIRSKNVDSVVAVKTQWTDSRGLWISFAPAIFTSETNRTSFVKKALNWMMPPSDSPTISLSVPSIDYGTVELNTPTKKTVDITNNGLANLVVSSINVTGEGYALATPPTYPLNIAPGTKYTAEITFTAVNPVVYNGSVAIASNDPSKPTASVTLTGKGKDAGVWEENLRGVSVRITPNPAVNEAKAIVTLPDNSTGALYVINSAGARVLTVSERVTAGETALPLDLSGLNSGAYFLVLDVRGSLLKTTLNVIR